MEWTWDPDKAAANLRKHGVLFETATLVFDDEYRLSLPDPHPDSDRWRTIGAVNASTLFVVHTDMDEDSPGRIFSARRATTGERKAYEALRFGGHDA